MNRSARLRREIIVWLAFAACFSVPVALAAYVAFGSVGAIIVDAIAGGIAGWFFPHRIRKFFTPEHLRTKEHA